MHEIILKKFKKTLGSAYNENIFETILEQNVLSNSLKGITLLPYRWNVSSGDSLSNKIEIEFGLITLFGWVGYTILDHAIDGQHNAVKSIPLAEKCIRELHWRLASTCDKQNERNFIIELFSKIEKSHAIECKGRVPKPWHKSAGHMICPLLLVLKQGNTLKSIRFKSSKKYFIEFLTIKQLSDDLRDWEEDWKAGRKTVVTEHLRKLITTDSTTVNFKKIRRLYTLNTLKHFCLVLIRHGNIALKALKKAGRHRDTDYFEQTVIRLQNGARSALDIIASTN